MSKPTIQQVRLGWENVDIENKHFLCMSQIENGEPFCLSAHCALTYALCKNGNMARNWKKEGGKAKESVVNGHKSGNWTLLVEGKTIKLWAEPIDKIQTPPVPIDYTQIKQEAGERGKSKLLLSLRVPQ